jgi:ribosome-associated translation inhibitor RaiA
MECTVTGRHMEISSELRQLIDRRLLPLERLLGDALVSADRGMATEHHQCVSEPVVHARDQHRMRGVAEGPNWPTAVGAAVDKVIHQAQTLEGRWHGRRREAALSSTQTERSGGAEPSAD